jgi:acyl phosphate:glycerol-3-phosphate acyltransferase
MIETLALVPWESATTYYYLGMTFFLAYLLGSIPFGLIFAWAAGAGDVRNVGSGNIGATNVLRTGNKLAAAATLFCDAAKGYVAVIVAGQYFGIQVFPAIAALGVFSGHVFPIWLKFRGGKGVATFLGIALAFSPPVAAVTCGSWLIMARASRYSSLAALFAATLTPIYFLFFGATLWAALMGLLAVLIFISHRSNIIRLINGTEPQIGLR